MVRIRLAGEWAAQLSPAGRVSRSSGRALSRALSRDVSRDLPCMAPLLPRGVGAVNIPLRLLAQAQQTHPYGQCILCQGRKGLSTLELSTAPPDSFTAAQAQPGLRWPVQVS